MATRNLVEELDTVAPDFDLDDSAIIPIATADMTPVAANRVDSDADEKPVAGDSASDYFAIRPSRSLSVEELSRLADEIDDLIEARAFVDAMDVLCEKAGVAKRRAHGLVTAMAAQPDLELAELLTQDEVSADGPSPQLMTEITELMDAGRKLEAIAHYSERMNVSLKEANSFIEALDDVTDFECEVAERNAMLPILAALGAGVLAITGAMAAMWALL